MKIPAILFAAAISAFAAEPSHIVFTTRAGIYGEPMKWHRMTFAFEGPHSSEGATPNPFLDYRLDVIFTHPKSGKILVVPGYYAADGYAGESSADSGCIWRAHFSPPEIGVWEWKARFVTGKNIAVSDSIDSGKPAPIRGCADDIAGKFTVAPSDKIGRDNRSRGLLGYTGERYLRWAETGGYFLKEGADAPENLFAYGDFDGDFKSDGEKDKLIKTYKPHLKDWKNGDPTWQGGKGKGLIGAVNYLASVGANSISFLTMNINGDDRNVFMYTNYKERERIDVSRMDQWETVMAHADRMGFYLHFKTQEAENDMLLDKGALGTERKLYYRELIARFGHHLALNWNLGEENHAQTDAQRIAMAGYFHDHDPYKHNIVIHTYPPQKAKIYTPLLGKKSELTGVSMQGSHPKFEDVHGDVLEWVKKSTNAGKPWVVACDEPGSAGEGLTTDTDDAADPTGNGNYTDARQKALWGVLLAGGAGTEWYFGYKFKDSDLTLQDFRSRNRWWSYCRNALEFFGNNKIPFQAMTNHNELVGNPENESSKPYCFAKPGEVYVLYFRDENFKKMQLDLTGQAGEFSVDWFDPRVGGSLIKGSVRTVSGGGIAFLAHPMSVSEGDWVALVRKY